MARIDMSTPVLHYVHDPMCSWCWAFTPVMQELMMRLPADLPVKRLVGGLAPDSDLPMPEDLRRFLQETWRRIQVEIPGARFNFDFWTQCTPRRSTYPACRAVLAARRQGPQFDPLMTAAIQHAYYLQARNPSDRDTLVELAAEIDLDAAVFARDLSSPSVDEELKHEIARARALGADSFPSLVLSDAGWAEAIAIDYRNSDPMLTQIEGLMRMGGYP